MLTLCQHQVQSKSEIILFLVFFMLPEKLKNAKSANDSSPKRILVDFGYVVLQKNPLLLIPKSLLDPFLAFNSQTTGSCHINSTRGLIESN